MVYPLDISVHAAPLHDVAECVIRVLCRNYALRVTVLRQTPYWQKVTCPHKAKQTWQKQLEEGHTTR